MKKFFVTLAVIMMIGLMATAAMAAQGADRNKPGGASIIDYFSATDNALQTLFAVHNILVSNWIRVHIIIYDYNSFKLIDFTITLSPRDVVAFNISSVVGSNSIRLTASSLQAGDIVPDTIPGWGTNWVAGGAKTGYISMVISSVGVGASGPSATPPAVWAPLWSGGTTVLGKGSWGIPPDAMFTTIYYINTAELHGESMNAVQFQGFENLPAPNTAKYNYADPFIRAPGNVAVAFNGAAGSIYAAAGTSAGFTAANSTSNASVPAPGGNTTMFAEYQQLDANNAFFLNFYSGQPRVTGGAPFAAKLLNIPPRAGFGALANGMIEYAPAGTYADQYVMSAGWLTGTPGFARVPGSKTFMFYGTSTPGVLAPAAGVGTQQLTVDFFNWGAGATTYDDKDDATGACIDSFELYVTDGWGNVLIGNSPATADAAALVPLPTLSLQAMGRWNNDPTVSMTTDLVTCYPASNATSNTAMFPFNGNIKSLYYFTYNDREFPISGVVQPLEVSRITFGKLTGQIQIPLATDTQGWVLLSSGSSTGLTYRGGLPFCGFLLTFAASPTARFSALTPLIDLGTNRIGTLGNGTNQLLAGGGWGNVPNLGTETIFQISDPAEGDARGATNPRNFFSSAFWNQLYINCLNLNPRWAGLCGLLAGFGSNPPSQPVINNGSASGGTVNGTGTQGEGLPKTN
ncbi:MAG: hypothetical protein HQK59_10835 [Deltaproteobacteria bacterium]|nr:hypothetical protein [Deltaproteobacteria bacterium]MBF0526763.1 hypothetical protein [Deltaproteobacteria bacterium]